MVNPQGFSISIAKEDMPRHKWLEFKQLGKSNPVYWYFTSSYNLSLGLVGIWSPRSFWKLGFSHWVLSNIFALAKKPDELQQEFSTPEEAMAVTNSLLLKIDHRLSTLRDHLQENCKRSTAELEAIMRDRL